MPAVTSIGRDAAARPVVVGIVGTDHHRFDRFVTWLDRWAAQHEDVSCVIQHGSSVAPTCADGKRLVGHQELQALIGRASAVVCHGGPGTITEVRMAGLVPIVVPRDPRLQEHVDAHQQRFAALMAQKALIRVADSSDELGRLLAATLAAPRPRRRSADDSPRVHTASRFGVLVAGLLGERPLLGTQRPAGAIAHSTEHDGG